MELLQDFFTRETPREPRLADQIWSLAEPHVTPRPPQPNCTWTRWPAAGFRITATWPTSHGLPGRMGRHRAGDRLLGEYDALSLLNQQSGALGVHALRWTQPGPGRPRLRPPPAGHLSHFAAIALQGACRPATEGARALLRPATRPGRRLGRPSWRAPACSTMRGHGAHLAPGQPRRRVQPESTLTQHQAGFIFHGKASHAGVTLTASGTQRAGRGGN